MAGAGDLDGLTMATICAAVLMLGLVIGTLTGEWAGRRKARRMRG